MNTLTVLKKPLITEKSIADAARGVYTFFVDPRANKHQIKQAVEDIFNVQVVSVTTLIRKPVVKRVSFRHRLPQYSSPIKIARLTLKEGQSIDIFDIKESQHA